MAMWRLLVVSFCLLFTVYYLHNGCIQPAQTHANNAALDYENGFSDQMHSGLVDFMRQNWIHAPSKFPLNLNNSRNVDFSQVGQSPFVDELLQRRTNGFFVECGAASGEVFSNTLFFERERGWSGLLIEANPKLFQEMVLKNRHAYLVNACLSNSNRTGRLTFYPDEMYGGLRSAAHVSPISVQCFPLYPLLVATGHTRVDYLSLDVEGAELPILRAIPFHALFIDVIGVEYRINTLRSGNHHAQKTMDNLNNIREFFRALGVYKEVAILPWGTHFNWVKSEAIGLDVFFKHI